MSWMGNEELVITASALVEDGSSETVWYQMPGRGPSINKGGTIEGLVNDPCPSDGAAVGNVVGSSVETVGIAAIRKK